MSAARLSPQELKRIASDQERINAEQISLGARENPTRLRADRSVAKLDAVRPNTIDDAVAVPVLRQASSITPRELEPLWPGVLWIGKPTLIVGDPGLGKSLATVNIAARASRGDPWPCETVQRAPGRVLMLSAEDDPDDTIVPRLIAAGADLERVTFFDGVRERDEHGESRQTAVSLDQHIETLRAALAYRGDYTLVIVDPISAFLGRADSHNNAEVRALLASLGRMAAEMRFAVLVVSHLNKMTGTNAVYRITGSLAFVAAARAVFAIARDPQDPDQRLMLPVKSNLGPDTAGYSYTVSVADNDAPFVRWGDDRVTRTAEEVLSAAPSPREQAVIERGNDVKEWLRKKLASEAQPAASMWAAAERENYSRRDVERAKRSLGVVCEPKGYRGAWHWSLPHRPDLHGEGSL